MKNGLLITAVLTLFIVMGLFVFNSSHKTPQNALEQQIDAISVNLDKLNI